MSLVTTKDMFEKSMKEHFAIGAFNVNNMEIIQGIVDAVQRKILGLFYRHLQVQLSMQE